MSYLLRLDCNVHFRINYVVHQLLQSLMLQIFLKDVLIYKTDVVILHIQLIVVMSSDSSRSTRFHR